MDPRQISKHPAYKRGKVDGRRATPVLRSTYPDDDDWMAYARGYNDSRAADTPHLAPELEKVAFRITVTGEVVAIFPAAPAPEGHRACYSFERGHWFMLKGDRKFEYSSTPATDVQFASTVAELRAQGRQLDILHQPVARSRREWNLRRKPWTIDQLKQSSKPSSDASVAEGW